MQRLRQVSSESPGIRRQRRGRGFSYVGPDGAPVAGGDRPAHPRARDPARVDRRLDLPGSDGSPAGDRHRRRRTASVPVPRALARSQGRREVRSDAHVRAPVATGARTRGLGPGATWPPSGEGARGCGSGCWTSRCSASGPSRTHATMGRSVWRRSGATTSEPRARSSGSTTAPRAASDASRRSGTPSSPRSFERSSAVATTTRSSSRTGTATGWRDVRSEDVNAYVKELAGEGYSAKDFRTWHGTVFAAVALAVAGEVPGTQAARRRRISDAVKEVALELGNTPSSRARRTSTRGCSIGTRRASRSEAPSRRRRTATSPTPRSETPSRRPSCACWRTGGPSSSLRESAVCRAPASGNNRALERLSPPAERSARCACPRPRSK